MITKIAIGIALLLSCVVANAQHLPKNETNLEVLADELFGFQDQDLNYQELYENMALLLANPINLNIANLEELRFLNLLSEYQIQSLIKHRQENGHLLSIFELQSIDGFDLITINKIVPFVTIDDGIKAINSALFKRIISEENNYLILRYDKTLEGKAGFKEDVSKTSRFQGSEDDIYVRFRTSNPGDFSLGFTLEKDAGEQIVWNESKRQYGFDYNSFHVQVLNKGKIKNLIIGDFQTQFGQGLILGGTFGYGKGSESVTTIRRSNLGFLPYTSVNEAGFNRGIAITYQVNPALTISPFYSHIYRDATTVQDSLENTFITSFQTTGFHRNENELKNRHHIKEQSYGTVINYRKNSIDAGVIINTVDYSIPVRRNPQPYNQYSFTGNSNLNVGTFLNYTVNNFTFFNEFAHTIHHGYGVTAGLLGSLTPKLDVAMHYRYYAKDFYSPSSNAFSESSTPQNEAGIYWGLKYRWNKTFSVSGYTDLFRFPWLRFRSYVPSEGYEWLVRFNYQPSKTVLLFVQAREESKVRNLNGEQQLYLTDVGIKRNYWINCDYAISPKLKLKTRAQLSTYALGENITKGITLLQDINLDFGKLSVTARYALFDTEDYDNRQYVYEKDVWLAYSLPAYSGQGVRKYILAQYSINKHFTFWIRYAISRYTSLEQIGSDVDAIEGNTKSDVRLQIRIKF